MVWYPVDKRTQGYLHVVCAKKTMIQWLQYRIVVLA